MLDTFIFQIDIGVFGVSISFRHILIIVGNKTLNYLIEHFGMTAGVVQEQTDNNQTNWKNMNS